MGTGEVVRYLRTFRSTRVSRIVLLSPLQPFLLRADDNPDGIDGARFRRLLDELALDRVAFTAAFLAAAFSTSIESAPGVSGEMLRYSWNAGVSASRRELQIASPLGSPIFAKISFTSTFLR